MTTTVRFISLGYKTPNYTITMRVLKIIQANPDLFNEDQNENDTEQKAIRTIVSMVCKGSDIQKNEFEIRQTHTAICNLMCLGFKESAIEMAVKLIPRAELSQQFRVAQDLCERLIKYFFHDGNIKSALNYKTLYDKFTDILTYEHESMLLCGNAIQNHKKYNLPFNIEETDRILEAINYKLPVDNLWYHYYYFHFKALKYSGKELEKIYLDAIEYFDNLHFNHNEFTHYFTKELVEYYEANNELEKAKVLMEKIK